MHHLESIISDRSLYILTDFGVPPRIFEQMCMYEVCIRVRRVKHLSAAFIDQSEMK
jgi:hypothetical protein